MTATLRHDHRPVHGGVDELAPVVPLSEVSFACASPLFVVADEAPIRPLVEHVCGGARVTLFLPWQSAGPVASDLHELGVHLGAPLQHPHPANPLVVSTATRLTGVGELAGLHLTVAAARALEGAGEPLVVDDDARAVVRRLALGAGNLVVVGSAEPLTERFFGSRDHVAFLTWAATGTVDRERAARLAARCAAPRPHADVPVLHVGPMAPLPVPEADPSDPVFVRAAGHARRLLPAHVHDALVDFVDAPPSAGALLLRGLPVGALPLTPPAPTAPTTKDRTSEMTLLTVARALGQPIGYRPEHSGDLVQNIVPVAASADRQTSTSSRVELMLHTEAAFHPHRPRYLLLLCLRGDPAAATTLASILEIAPQLPLDVRAVLFEPRFRTAVDESYLGARPTRLGAPMPVLTGDWDHPTMVFDADLMVGVDDEAEAALQQLTEATKRCHTSVVLDAGDLLVVDNFVAVHGRTPFTPRFDGTDRWLQRAFVVCDLAASSGERDGRVVVTEFIG